MRSTWSTGRSWNAVSPALTEPTRTPSISTSTWSASAPRMNTLLSLPWPPWLPMSMPARPRSRSVRLRAWLRTISSWSMTWAGKRLSASATWVRVAVTTTSSRSVAAAPSATANGGMDRTPATASAMIRDCIGTLLLRAHPRTRNKVEARTTCTGPRGSCAVTRVRVPACEALASVCGEEGGGRGVGVGHAPASPPRCPPHHNRTGSMDPCSVAGLRTCEWESLTPAAAPSRGPRCGAGQWRMRWRELAYRCGGSAGMVVAHVARRISPASRFNPLAQAAGSPRSGEDCTPWAGDATATVRITCGSGHGRDAFDLQQEHRGHGRSHKSRSVVGVVEQLLRRRVVLVLHHGRGHRRGGRAVARWRELGDGGFGLFDQFDAALVGYFLPVAIPQRPFERIEQVEAGLEAGTL